LIYVKARGECLVFARSALAATAPESLTTGLTILDIVSDLFADSRQFEEFLFDSVFWASSR